MATLPSATTRIDDTAGPAASGVKYCAVLAPVPTMADYVPRVYSNAASIAANHGYSQGVDYAAHHIKNTGLPVLFVPMIIDTAGVVGSLDGSGNTNTSICSASAGSSGSLDEVDGVVRVKKGGVVGTDQILLEISLDGGRSYLPAKLGTASLYQITTAGGYQLGVELTFAGGSLTTGETILTFRSTAPLFDAAGIALAKTALANQTKLVRDIVFIGDIPSYAGGLAQAVKTAVEGYETTDERYACARISLRDRLPLALSGSTSARMVDANVTFANVSEADTITRDTGSFISDGFVVGDSIIVSGMTTVGNNIDGDVIATVAAKVLTFGSGTLLTNEGPRAGISITAQPTAVFHDNGESADTLTRNRGSWLNDGFRVGQSITISGTSSNNVTKTVTVLTATTLTVATGSFADETISMADIDVSAGETVSNWVSALDSEYSALESRRVNASIGRARVTSPFLNSMIRRSVLWDDVVRSYQHDIHIPTFAKALGPTGADLNDADGNLAEYDERVVGGALAGRFTCYRTWGNGPAGAYIALSLTRAAETSVLSRQQNMTVVNLAQSVCQAAAENAIGLSLVLNSDGTPTSESIALIKQKVDSALARALLANAEGEGQRCSDVYWTPDPSTDMRVAGTVWPCVLSIVLNGTLEHISTTIKVNG